MVKYPDVDLKLGIKSSLPNVRATLGLLLMLWKSGEKPAEVNYSKQEGNSIEVSDEIKNQLINKYRDFYLESGVSDEDFIKQINKNQLFKSQLEALIVAFELIWKVAKIRFSDNKPASAERTGGIRYPKTLLFTKNLDILDLLLSSNEKEYSNVLLSWIGIDVTVENSYEISLMQLLVYISEEAVYKLVDDDNEDIIFNMNGVYKKLLDEGESVDITDSKEAKGSLRILRSALSDNLNPFLSFSNTEGVSIIDGLEEELELYQKRVDAYLSLSNTKYVLETRPSEDDAQSEEERLDEASYELSRLTSGKNILLYGVPGSGKSWTIEHEYCDENDKIERLVFHPDYTNADFIGQILPVVDPIDGQVTYEFTPGPFTNILNEAYNNPLQSFVLIIEEINRGNAPAIFGDVFQLLDRLVDEKNMDGLTYPIGTSEYGITNENVAEVVYKDNKRKVRIPSNLSIIGTMNTSDQNVFTLDTAFQRRWRMRLIENNFDNVRSSLANAMILDTSVSWKTFCETVNTIIIGNKAKLASAEDKRLGVYFIHENDLKFDDRALPEDGYETLLSEYNELIRKEQLNQSSFEEKDRLHEIREALVQNRVFPEKVIKYLWDDAFKFNPEAIFDTTDMDNLEKVIRTFVYSKGNERFKIFKQSVRSSLIPSQ